MSHWTITGRPGCPVAGYVTQVVSEEEIEDPSAQDQALHRWVVEACEGQIQQLINDPDVVRVTWERR